MYLQNPAKSHKAVVANTALPIGTVALYVGVGGDVQVTVGGVTVVYKNVPDGGILPVRAEQVVSTSTTATDIVALTN